MQGILNPKIQHKIFNHLIIRITKKLFDDERTKDYVASAKTFAQEFSSVFCSLAVNLEKISVNDICW
nr:hypothetical protein [uncultured Agathobacter sp.]